MLTSCSESGRVVVELANGESKLRIEPKSSLTSSCVLEFEGDTDCDLFVHISSEKSFKISKGKFSVRKEYECYEKGKALRILSQNCSDLSTLEINYRFSKGYYGQKK